MINEGRDSSVLEGPIKEIVRQREGSRRFLVFYTGPRSFQLRP